jgi:hypothetical protein
MERLMTDGHDPLGYDKQDPNYMRKMARDALEGRNEAAVDAEADRLRMALGMPPRPPTRWNRCRRWLLASMVADQILDRGQGIDERHRTFIGTPADRLAAEI